VLEHTRSRRSQPGPSFLALAGASTLSFGGKTTSTPKQGFCGNSRIMKKLSRKSVNRRNDRYSTFRPELTLIRVGHYLWARYKRSCGISGYVSERQALYTALETVWERKVELRAELKAQRAGKMRMENVIRTQRIRCSFASVRPYKAPALCQPVTN
jgi:hypothetical protein